MNAEDVKNIKENGPLNFEYLQFIKNDGNNIGIQDSVYYNESLEGFVKVVSFNKNAIRFPVPNDK